MFMMRPSRRGGVTKKNQELIMTYHPAMEVFPSEDESLQEKMLRLRQQIIEAQGYRRKLDSVNPVQEGAAEAEDSDLDMSYWTVEKQITDLRIWEMESRLTGLLDVQGD
jgi:hypothetical protein